MSKEQLAAAVQWRLNNVLPNAKGQRVANIGEIALHLAIEFANVASRDEIADIIRGECERKGIVPER